jgi:hypothetical protein
MKGKRVYVAASFERKDEVKKVLQILRENGHTITADWTGHQYVTGDTQAKALARSYAIEDTDGVKTADVFVLLVAERKTFGAHVELGIALGAGVEEIYLVGQSWEEMMFYYHPTVKKVATVEKLLRRIAG